MDILIEEYQEKIWAVALNQGKIEGFEIDPLNEEIRYGSIYYAKVERIDAAQDAAFLNLDGENYGILYNKDVRFKDKDGNICKGGKSPIGKTLPPGSMVAVQAKSAYVRNEDGLMLEEDKSPQMSMDISLPGRYLIYCAMMQTNVISQRIRGKKLRKQLNNMIAELDDMKGLILRSAAADLQTDILQREAAILRGMWYKIEEGFIGNEPKCLSLGANAIQRMLGDMATNPIDRIEIVTMDHFEQIEAWCSVFAPDLVTKIIPVELREEDATQDLALLEYRDVLGQIEFLFQDYVFLKNGGNLLIEEPAALTAIDVNKGSDTRSKLDTNIEAAKEIARQIRLRNIGSIIIVDFINMNKKDQAALLKVLDEETYSDPCTVQIHGFTKLGLIEMTRKRRTPSLNQRFGGVAF